MKKRVLGLLTVALALTVTASMAACSGASDSDSSDNSADSPTDPSKVSGDITVLTHRTDLVGDGTMDEYVAEFQKTYPKVNVTFEAITDYASEVKIRMNTEDYGDVLFIPATVQQSDYASFFASLGDISEMSEKYRFTSYGSYDGTVYGLSPNGNANGFVYNKTVWANAGITEWPATTDELLADLQKIKDSTESTPYYTNYKDGWPVSAWQSALGLLSCDAEANNKFATTESPWSEGNELYTSDSLLYDIVDQGLSEADPTTTNWESSKGMLAKGEIATMFLGSWSIIQMQQAAEDAGLDPSVIGYMPFPSESGDNSCSTIAPDYQQAINIHSENKAAARAWVDWFVDESTYAVDTASVPTLKSGAYPDTLKALQDAGVEFFEMSQDQAAKVNEIDSESEVGINSPDYRQKIIDVARGSLDGSLEDIFADLNKKWAAGI